MGALGQVMIFLSLLVLQAVVGVYILAFAAYSFLVVVEGTAAGMDEIAWPDEPITDWLGRFVHLVFLTAVWLIPLALFLRYSKPAFLADTPALRFVILAVPVMWLLFPVGLLSSLSATSPWVVFNPKLLAGLGRCFGSVLGFYFVSLLLLAGCGGLWYVALASLPLLLPVVGVASATVLLVYGRLLGRVAWLLNRLDPDLDPLPPVTRKVLKRVKVDDPWEVSTEEPEEKKEKKEKQQVTSPSTKVEGYGLAEEPVESEADQPAPEEEDPSLAEKKPRKKKRSAAVGEEEEPRPKRRSQRQKAAPLPPPPEMPLLSGVYTFPWYPATVQVWVWLCLGGVIQGGLFLLLVQFWPG